MKHHSLIWLVGATLALASCQTNPEDKNIQVVATLFPQYSIAETLVGDLVDVSFLLENGGSIHGYEPTPSQVVALNTADVVLYTGEFVESWMHQIEESASGALIDVSTGITLLEGHDGHDHEDEVHDDPEDDHHDDEGRERSAGEEDEEAATHEDVTERQHLLHRPHPQPGRHGYLKEADHRTVHRQHETAVVQWQAVAFKVQREGGVRLPEDPRHAQAGAKER